MPGKYASSVPTTIPHVEPPFSVGGDTGTLLSAINSFSESDLWNVGNTRPSQRFRPFSCDDAEKTYLIYFVLGDMHAYWHGTKVRAEGGTTHLAQLELLRELFGTYVKPIITPTVSPNGQYGLRATFDLHRSFDFLIGKIYQIPPEILHDDRSFYAALSGFADAEGHVGLKRSARKAYAQFSVSNRNRQIMSHFLQGLKLRGHSGNLYALHSSEIMWHLELFGTSALDLLQRVTFRHREKIIAKQIAFEYNAQLWSVAGTIYRRHREAIRLERDALDVVAEHRYMQREERKQQKIEIWKSKVETTFSLFAEGLTMQELVRKLNCSVRTAYRRKEKFRESLQSKKSKKQSD